ncbi:MAG TPA: ABC transporter ATP-binding protein [Halococcus sp.]|nr:ABC transporter ATP-binding protein [Halococcus sp.]
MAAIAVTDLTKEYGSVVGIDSLSFSVEKGEVFGFLGPNGAGKTTTIRTLMGFQSPTAGGATVLGYDITNEREVIEMKRHVGYLSSDPAFDENVTGRRYLSYHAALKGDERSDELLSLFDPPLNRKIREYSRGNKQKLAIVLALMHDPELVIMDEPTSGLDPLMQERFLEFIRTEQQRGKTFFFSSHILNEVQKVCNRVGIIRDGHLVEVEDVETLLHRGGKEVRVHVAEAVDEGEFAIDGAHEVELTKSGSPRAVEADGGDVLTEDSGQGTSVSFTYTGGFETLLTHLLDYTIIDLDIEEAPLEDVFMRFYGEHGDENDV